MVRKDHRALERRGEEAGAPDPVAFGLSPHQPLVHMNRLRALGLLAATAALLIASPAPSAQQGGTAGVGIIGGVQPNQFPTAGRVKVTQPGGVQFFLPLNGIRNYLVFYAPDANGNDRFAPAGTYAFEYQTSGGSHAPEFPGGPIFNGSASYQPNTTFSQGGVIVVRNNGQVQAPNISPNPAVGRGPLGIQGFVQNSAGTRLFNASVVLARCSNSTCSSSTFVADVRTNGNGFYSFYYTEGTNKNFIQPGLYRVTASASGLTSDTVTKQYSPSTTAGADFFVLGAQESAAGVRTLVLRASSPPPPPPPPPYPCFASQNGSTETSLLPPCPIEDIPLMAQASEEPLPSALPMPEAARSVVFGPVEGAEPTVLAGPSRQFAGTASVAADAPDGLALLGAWPNPVASRGAVRFTLGDRADVQVDLFDTLGRRVASLAAGSFGPGAHEVALDAAGLPPGTYVLRLAASGETRTALVTVAR